MGSEQETEQSGTGELEQRIRKADGIAQSLESDLPPSLARHVGHLRDDLVVLESWIDGYDETGAEALAGSLTVVETDQKRASHLIDKVGDSDEDLRQRLSNLEDELEEIENELEELDAPSSAFVTYVDLSFAARYRAESVTIGDILGAAGLEDVDELGLWPLKDLFGDRLGELALPDEEQVNLSNENRTYWESESDGGSIAWDRSR